MTEFDTVPVSEIRFRGPSAPVLALEAAVRHAAGMPRETALRLPQNAKRAHIVAAVKRYAPGALFVRCDCEGRYVLTRRKVWVGTLAERRAAENEGYVAAARLAMGMQAPTDGNGSPV